MPAAEIYYLVCFLLALVLAAYYALNWHKHFDVHFTLIFILVPISNLGHLLLAQSVNREEALAGNKIIYIGACYLQLMLMLNVFSLCHIRLNRWIKTGLLTVSSVIFLMMLTAGHSDIFYRRVTYVQQNGVATLQKEYGPIHAVFLVVIGIYAALSIIALVYSYFKKRDVSHRILFLLLLTEMISMICYFGGKKFSHTVELIPASYVLGQIVYLLIIRRVFLYDITDSAIDSLVQTGATGLASFDFKMRYLGSNATAKRMLPVLKTLRVDEPTADNTAVQDTVLQWMQAFQADNKKNTALYQNGENTYLITVNYLFDGFRRRGYQLFLTDDTKNQKYISLINQFNTDLRAQVAEKTAHLVEMHDRLILSMASMVESRDNSTGGHIRRTSAGVRILIGEMRADEACTLTDDFCRKLIKAAPMHDLGKIAVDDAVLRKPGRFTPEEFEKMKVHAAEGARIVHGILEGTDDLEFHLIAENVAHYHHERWDGSGYPEQLKGEQIPIEARIMAIADVYDALVSRRVYKDSMSFAQADKIISEGMGTQFDPALAVYYRAARPKLEAYYSSLSAEGAQ